MSEVKERIGAEYGGWAPDIPDSRDMTLCDIPEPLKSALSQETSAREVDLREYFPHAGCESRRRDTVARACVSMMEYFNRRCLGELTRLSCRFLHDITIRLDPGLQGASIRSALKAIKRTGLPPRRLADAASHEVDLTADPLLYRFADFGQMTFYRIDSAETSFPDRLATLKSLLGLGLPAVIGMPLSSSLSNDARLDYRPGEQVIGGAAAVIAGYDDDYWTTSRGAFRFQSTWGEQWGEDGFGWLSYKLFEHGLIRDIWFVIDPRWMEDGLPLP